MLRRALRRLQRSGFGVAPVTALNGTAAAAAAVRQPTPGFTEFGRRASLLKKRFRGKAQYAFAREEAQRFLDAEVPKSNLNSWMEEGTNAIALSQVLRFFSVQPEGALVPLLVNKLVSTAEAAGAPAYDRLEATFALMSLRPDENYERAFATVEDVLKGELGEEPWKLLDLCAKVLQRCGKRVPTALSDRLTQAIMNQLRQMKPEELPALQGSLLRIYSWMVRAELEESRQILYVLVEHTGEFRSYDFSTLLASCGRHHQSQPLPVEFIQKLARTGLQYCTAADGRDAATVLGTIARMLSSLEPGKNGVRARDVSELGDRFNALLEDYQPRVLRLLDSKDRLYWSDPEDVTTMVFAYELGGRLRYHQVFSAYAAYVVKEMASFEPPQLAMATGMLRRSQCMSPKLLNGLSDRIETVLGEFKLAELGHICATFALLTPPPSWMEEARAVALRLMSPDASGSTRCNLALAFPYDDSFIAQIDYTQMSGRQLVDALTLATGKPSFETPLISALVVRLTGSQERFSPDDVRWMLSPSLPTALTTAVQSYLYRCFTEPAWSTDTLFYLPLMIGPNPSSGTTTATTVTPATDPARNPAKALEAAKQASISPEQFVALVELLTSVFGDTDRGIVHFAVSGGEDLLAAEDSILPRTVVRYLSAVRPYASLRPNEHWLSLFTEKMSTRLRQLKPEELESLLISLHAMYTDITTTPALQMLLWELVQSSFASLPAADVQTGRITVLLVYLQRGMSLPLLTTSTPLVKKVMAEAVHYPADVRDAVQNMPLPPPVEKSETRLGRFTLKQMHHSAIRKAAAESGDVDEAAMEDEAEDHRPLLDLTEEDPFNEAQSAAATADSDGSGVRSGVEGTSTSAATAGEEGGSSETATDAAAAAAAESERQKSATAADTSEEGGANHTEDRAAAMATNDNATAQSEAVGRAAGEGNESGETTTSAPSSDFSSSNAVAGDADAADHTATAKQTDNTAAPVEKEEEVVEAAGEEGASKPTSYYAKFFSTSVGQLFKGVGHAEKEEDSTGATTAGTRSADSAPLQPRRTTLRVGHHNHLSSTAPTSSAAVNGFSFANATTSAPPTGAAAGTAAATFTGWKEPPTFASEGVAGTSAPTAAAAVAVAEPAVSLSYGVPTAAQNATLFSNLFDPHHHRRQSTTPSDGAGAGVGIGRGGAPASPSSTPPSHHSTAFSALFGEARGEGGAGSAAGAAAAAAPTAHRGNHVFVQPTAGAGRVRPVITRKVGALRSAGKAEGEHDAASASHRSNVARAVVASWAGDEPASSGAGTEAQIVMDSDNGAETIKTNAEIATFMSKVGVTKISGYNIDGSDAGGVQQQHGQSRPSSTAQSAAAAVNSPLAWQEAARSVSRATRHTKTNKKTRGQQSLSDWLSTPTSKLASTADGTSAGAGGGGGGGSGGSRNGSAASANSAATTAAAAGGAASASAKRGRGRGGKKDSHSGAGGDGGGRRGGAGTSGGKGRKSGAGGTSSSAAAAAARGRGGHKKGGSGSGAAAAAASAKAKGKAKKAASSGGGGRKTTSAASRSSSGRAAPKSARKTIKQAARKATVAAKKGGKGGKKR